MHRPFFCILVDRFLLTHVADRFFGIQQMQLVSFFLRCGQGMFGDVLAGLNLERVASWQNCCQIVHLIGSEFDMECLHWHEIFGQFKLGHRVVDIMIFKS